MASSQSQLSRYSTTDRILVGAAFIALISLFLPWYQASVSGYTIQSVSGWGSGYGWLGGLCLVVAGVYLVLRRSEVDMSKIPVRSSVTLLVLSGLGTLIVLIRIGTLPSGHAGSALISYKYGPAVGIILALLAGIVETVCAFLAFRRRGTDEVVEAPPVPHSDA